MDFSKLKKKLSNRCYKTKEEFSSDVMLIFNNALTYNQPSSIFYKYALELRGLALDMLGNLNDNIREENTNGTKHDSRRIKRKSYN